MYTNGVTKREIDFMDDVTRIANALEKMAESKAKTPEFSSSAEKALKKEKTQRWVYVMYDQADPVPEVTWFNGTAAEACDFLKKECYGYCSRCHKPFDRLEKRTRNIKGEIVRMDISSACGSHFAAVLAEDAEL